MFKINVLYITNNRYQSFYTGDRLVIHELIYSDENDDLGLFIANILNLFSTYEKKKNFFLDTFA